MKHASFLCLVSGMLVAKAVEQYARKCLTLKLTHNHSAISQRFICEPFKHTSK